MKIWSTNRPQHKLVATCSTVFRLNRKSVRIVHWVKLSTPVLHPCCNAFLWNMFLCFIYDKRQWDNVKILTNDMVWQLLPLYPQGLLQKKAKLVWHDLFLTDLCWLLIISFIWLFPLFFFFSRNEVKLGSLQFLIFCLFSAFWHLIQPSWIFRAFKAYGSEIASLTFVNKLRWLERTILHQYILICSARFLDPDLPFLWLLLPLLAINLQRITLLKICKMGIKCFGFIDNAWCKASTTALPSSMGTTNTDSQHDIISLSCLGSIIILSVYWADYSL